MKRNYFAYNNTPTQNNYTVLHFDTEVHRKPNICCEGLGKPQIKPNQTKQKILNYILVESYQCIQNLRIGDCYR